MDLTNVKELYWGNVKLSRLLFDGVMVWSNHEAVMRILQQPMNAQTKMNGTVQFTVRAMGARAYNWQISADGISWSNINGYSGVTGAYTNTLTINSAGSWHAARMYRCLLTDAFNEQIATNVVGITILANCVITEQPTDVVGHIGERIKFSVRADDTTYYEWQYSSDGGTTWTKISSTGNGSDYTPGYSVSVEVDDASFSRLYRCELRDTAWRAAYTNTVRILKPDEAYLSIDTSGNAEIMGATLTVNSNGAGTLSNATLTVDANGNAVLS